MWVKGGKYGSIDPCFPSKVAQAHIHHLLFDAHSEKKPLKYIFFPILTHVPNWIVDTMDNASCPIVAGAPDVMKAAFTKEVDFFATRGIEFLDPALSFVEPTLMARRMFETFGPRLGITEDENDFACKEGWKALTAFERDLQEKGRAILETVEHEDRVAILMIGRPYHSDPGLNHGIPEEFQVLGYPILSVRSIPRDAKYLERFYKEDIEKGRCKSGARAQPRVAGELLGQQRAEGVGGGLRGAPPERRRAGPVVLQVRARRAGLRAHRRDHRDEQDAVRGAARHRREQAERQHQDPREDVRPRAQAPRGAPAGRAQAPRASSRTRSTGSASSFSRCAPSSSPRAATRTPPSSSRSTK